MSKNQWLQRVNQRRLVRVGITSASNFTESGLVRCILSPVPDPSVTDLLAASHSGNAEAFDQAFEIVYSELRRTARQRLGSGGPHTLSATS